MSSRSLERAVSVIIPTYNRSDLLRRNLEQMAGQTVDRNDFEVVVADDGSSDDTREVVDSFRDQLNLKYFFQEDRGYRLAQIRNEGARIAVGTLLVFLDTGTFVGRNFLRAHLDAQRTAPGPNAILGYTYGYNPDGVDERIGSWIAELTPECVVDRHAEDPALKDFRHAMFASCDFDLTRLALPWQGFFGLNFSIPAADYAAVGGYDDTFTGWGFEDCEFGYRVHHKGIDIRVSREAWAIESPHERDPGRYDTLLVNMHHFFTKHPCPEMEVGWALIMRERSAYWTWEAELHKVRQHARRARDLDVEGEVASAAAQAPEGSSIAVLGCGGRVPESLPRAVLFDFDADLVEQALATSGGRHTGRAAIGLRTTLPDQGVDKVVITSRLRGLWGRWQADLLAEAHRIGRAVQVFE